jgi:putative flavoprotein involved in K+ transport
MRFPGDRHAFPGKDAVADYLEDYARTFELPVRSGTVVESLQGAGGHWVASIAGGGEIVAGQVVLATGAFRVPFVPPFAADLDPSILQLHTSDYRNPSQLRPGPVAVIGASNSGADIALEIARSGGHPVTLIGRNTGSLPFDPEGRLGRWLDPLIWFAANHVLSRSNPIGRRAVAEIRPHGEPVERARPDVLRAARVDRIELRATGARRGRLVLADDRTIEAANVVWATGFRSDYSFVDGIVIGDDGWPVQERGVLAGVGGAYVVGLAFQTRLASQLIGGVGRDAEQVVRTIVARSTRSVAATDQVRAATG